MFLVLLSLYASKSLAKLTNYNSSSSDSDTVFFDELPGFKETFHPELGVGKGPFFARPADAATFILSLAFIPLTLATAFWLHRRQAVQPNLKLAHWLAVFLLITYHILTAIQSGILNRTLLSAAHPPTGIWWKISSYMKPLLRGKIEFTSPLESHSRNKNASGGIMDIYEPLAHFDDSRGRLPLKFEALQKSSVEVQIWNRSMYNRLWHDKRTVGRWTTSWNRVLLLLCRKLDSGQRYGLSVLHAVVLAAC
ncbi:hypothetical protein DL96DRAFT_914233 [Flagelloscypha sp. PMI_526]|nr:hypothetical protein DL96DRAFT_914233 [Flagelloscypha sp. PMI_526]